MAKQVQSWKAFLIVLAILAAIAGGIFLIGRYKTPASPYETLYYNNFEFQKIENVWYTHIQRNEQLYNVGLRYNPKETETVPIRGRLNETFKRQPYFVTFDPDENSSNFKYLALGVAEFGLNVVRGLGGEIVSACTKNLTEACENRPIVTCDNDDLAVVHLRTRNETRVRLEGNCLIIEGTELDIIKATDRVLYHFYKIMP
jgi:hypothetical protein